MVKDTPVDLQAKAREQYTEELRGYGHGFAFSDVPAFIVVPRRKVKGKHLPAQCLSVDAWRDPSRWAQVREELEAGMRDRKMDPDIPKGWTFGGLVKDAKPHRFDLGNPRIYSLNGTLIPWDNVSGEVSGYSAAHFEDRLLSVFLNAKPNDQAAEVEAFMEHHRTNGGNAQALMLFVEEMLERWKVDPPERVAYNPMRYEPILRLSLLVRTLERWLAKVEKGAPAQPLKSKPKREASTFAELFGAHLPLILAEMEGLGIGPVHARGKRHVVAALHAACKYYQKELPQQGHWPPMLKALFPKVSWGKDMVPERTPANYKEWYRTTYVAMMDRLK